MTKDDKAHLKRLVHQAGTLMIKKYAKGVKEHGGHLWQKPGLLDEAIDEATDQVVYLLTLKEQLGDKLPGGKS
jgi:hypothetical protein